ncbi:MAG: YraN family protein [Clostridia bacterium]|nr:YraN family protein [Clostridia bacterium]
MNLNKKGKAGENATVHYLRKKGYKILERNYFCRFGEIDIIAEKGDYLAFVEVKTRSENFLYSPLEAVTTSKQNKILKTAQVYLSKNNLSEKQPRFDIAEVYLIDKKINKINYIENAF